MNCCQLHVNPRYIVGDGSAGQTLSLRPTTIVKDALCGHIEPRRPSEPLAHLIGTVGPICEVRQVLPLDVVNAGIGQFGEANDCAPVEALLARDKQGGIVISPSNAIERGVPGLMKNMNCAEVTGLVAEVAVANNCANCRDCDHKTKRSAGVADANSVLNWLICQSQPFAPGESAETLLIKAKTRTPAGETCVARNASICSFIAPKAKNQLVCEGNKLYVAEPNLCVLIQEQFVPSDVKLTPGSETRILTADCKTVRLGGIRSPDNSVIVTAANGETQLTVPPDIALTTRPTNSLELFPGADRGHNGLSGHVKVSGDAGNAIVIRPNGLYSAIETPETPITTVPSSTLILLPGANNGHTNLSGNVKISQAAGNLISANSDGIYASDPPETPFLPPPGNNVTWTAGGPAGHSPTANISVTDYGIGSVVLWNESKLVNADPCRGYRPTGYFGKGPLGVKMQIGGIWEEITGSAFTLPLPCASRIRFTVIGALYTEANPAYTTFYAGDEIHIGLDINGVQTVVNIGGPGLYSAAEFNAPTSLPHGAIPYMNIYETTTLQAGTYVIKGIAKIVAKAPNAPALPHGGVNMQVHWMIG